MIYGAFSKLYRRHYDIASKFNLGLKSLLKQGLSEPEFCGDLVYKGHLCLWREDSLKDKCNTKHFKINFYLIFSVCK